MVCIPVCICLDFKVKVTLRQTRWFIGLGTGSECGFIVAGVVHFTG